MSLEAGAASGVTLRDLGPGDVAECERLLRALPAWFGIESALVAYVEAVSRLGTVVAQRGDEVVGFATLERRTDEAGEIHVMAVAPEHHGEGIGRKLVEALEARLVAAGASLLQVKTLGPSRPDADYERTRGFYRRLGFLPLEENDSWGSANPCYVLVKPLTPPTPAGVPPALAARLRQPLLLASAAPQLVVADVERSARHYRDVLGFEMGELFGDPPLHCIVSRDLVEIFLGRGEQTAPSNSTRRGAGIDAYVRVRGLELLLEELRERAADVVEGPVRRPYGMDEVVVRDGDGFVLVFAERAAQDD